MFTARAKTALRLSHLNKEKMQLKNLYEKLYKKLIGEGPFKFILKIPGMEKFLQYEVISYLFFGVMTTVVNFIAAAVAKKFLGESDTVPLFNCNRIGIDIIIEWSNVQAISWFVAVVFAYITNKLFVFESRSWKMLTVLKEIISFFGARIFTFFAFEELLLGIIRQNLHLTKNGFDYDYWLAKLFTAILVIIFNYVASKLVIFRKKKSPEKTEE